jgi:hypothetical protein
VRVGSETIYSGHVVYASSSNDNVWVLTHHPNHLEGDIRLFKNGNMYRQGIDGYQPISCQAFGDVCYVLCENHHESKLFKYNLDSGNLIRTEIPFPVTSYDTGINICLGVSSAGTLEINSTNGVWTWDVSMSQFVWVSQDNSDVIYTTTIEGKRFIVNSSTFSYDGSTMNWSSPDMFPRILPGGTLSTSSYWYSGDIKLF